jgi:hypothetical protein
MIAKLLAALFSYRTTNSYDDKSIRIKLFPKLLPSFTHNGLDWTRRQRLVELYIGTNPTRKGTWMVALNFGPGAGYLCGRTAFLARNCKGGDVNKGVAMYVPTPWRAAFTGNSNAVPYIY